MPKRKRPIRKTNARQRHISVRAVRRDPPDLRRLGRAVIALALAQAQAEADAEAQSTGGAESKNPASAPADLRAVDEESSDER